VKRIIVGLLTAFLMTAGLVAVSPSTATATTAQCLRYNNCTKTQTTASGPRSIRIAAKPTFKASVKAAGNVAPRGSVKLTVTKGSRKVYVTTKTVARASANSARATFKLPKFKTIGNYRLVFKYTPAVNTVFVGSQTVKTLTVRR
jgi:hypothetical protein